MFDSYVQTSSARGRRWLRLTVLVSALAHAVGVLIFVAWSFWQIDKLEARHVPVSFAKKSGARAQAPLAAAPQAVARAPEKRRPRELVQPRKDVPPVDLLPAADVLPSSSLGATDTGSEAGVPDGQEGANGPGGSSEQTAAALPPLPPPEPPRFVPQVAIKASRLTAADPRLGDDVLALLVKQEVRELLVVVNLCLSSSGVPTTITWKKGSGFDLADQRIEAGLRAWRFRPFEVGGKAVPVCTFWTLKYRIE